MNHKRLITLLYKGKEKKQFSNYCPITLFDVTYKIFTKAFQVRLQLVFIWMLSTKINQLSCH